MNDKITVSTFHYEDRASAAENNSAISSDDPEAITLLKEKIAKAETEQEKYTVSSGVLPAGHGSEC